MALSKFLHGNKTYIAGVATLLAALSGYASGEMDQQTAITISVTAILATLLRAGSKGDTREAVQAAQATSDQIQQTQDVVVTAAAKAHQAATTTQNVLDAVGVVQQSVDNIKTITKK